VFDFLWKVKLGRRREKQDPGYPKSRARGSAYKWLREQLGISREECHIGRFDLETCHKVVELCLPAYRRILDKGFKEEWLRI
jgi:hypothetical protein